MVELHIREGLSSHVRPRRIVDCCPYAWRVHERISHACSGREIGPSAQSRILSQQEGSLVGYLTNLPGICAAVGVHVVGPNPGNDDACYRMVLVGCMAAGNTVLNCISIER
jgi:hypothetical protein